MPSPETVARKSFTVHINRLESAALKWAAARSGTTKIALVAARLEPLWALLRAGSPVCEALAESHSLFPRHTTVHVPISVAAWQALQIASARQKIGPGVLAYRWLRPWLEGLIEQRAGDSLEAAG